MQKLQLSIPEPCHENWQQMTPTDQGRFCKSCAKEVIDFSMMTDMQVLNYFSTLTHEKVCGRAMPDQLNRTISRPKDPKKRLFWYWNYIAMFFMFFGKGNVARAQGDMKLTTEISPAKADDVNKAPGCKVGGARVINSRVISGKVTDIDGNPVSFASIKIKGMATGVSADANGAYSLKIDQNDVLVISGGCFKSTEVPVSNQSLINTVLEMGCKGQIVFVDSDLDYAAPDKTKAVAILKVKDEETGKFLPNASILINVNSGTETAFTDRKGMYKMKGIKENKNYFIKVLADGYESNEFTISGYDFKDRKKEWEVLLRKQKVDVKVRSTAAAMLGTETRVSMGQVQVINENKWPLYVVDGIIMPKDADISPDDVETYEVLQAPAATLLFGAAGSNGAIVITTRKSKEIKMKEVVVTSDYGTKRISKSTTCWTGITDCKLITTNPKKALVTEADNQLRVYPNPVQRGNTFNLSLQLKQTGLYQIQITDAMGRIVLQKQINVITKEATEKIEADSRWSSGLYYISLIDNKNQLVNKSSFIFQ